ncbi:GMP/IMP nucleotidase [Desulfobacca acetoxidans]|uniref:HAD-superfamily hydrolase, subfamily IA, variant 3 n=1 Tax=Desulfobacca acetoxidans (strain ATCC 700848 / DSM 11109 / ASRB2) TaxID=880072 RepID=F2NGX2_DESAR|nr:GMP/IMP nucleotidase [Desulfobacca acetoxidans]AEB08743.1 HAD-superfamily hydrolase, subfamily IA, variant 3 [Desulfobacca acetoxidans DSM 11109]
MHVFNWQEVDWVLLDMDGTLLDKHFDDYFWETLVPREYACRQGLELAAARQEVFARYQRQEGTLNWTDIDFWSRELDLDIPALKEGIRHLIEVHPDSEPFLRYVRRLHKRVILVTNAHYKTLELKMNQVGLLGCFDAVLSSFDLGAPKEDRRFWQRLEAKLQFEPGRTMLVDDNREVLQAARNYGVRFVFFKARSSSQAAPETSRRFPVIHYFTELMPPLESAE